MCTLISVVKCIYLSIYLSIFFDWHDLLQGVRIWNFKGKKTKKKKKEKKKENLSAVF